MKKIKGWGLLLLVVTIVLAGSMWNRARNVERAVAGRAESEAVEEISLKFNKSLGEFFYANRRLARAGDAVKGSMDLPAYIKEWRLLENGVLEVDINPGWSLTLRKVKLIPIVESRRLTYQVAGQLSPDLRGFYGSDVEFLSDADIERQLALNEDRIQDALAGKGTVSHGKVLVVSGGNVCVGGCIRDLPCANARPFLCRSNTTKELKGTGTEYRGTNIDRVTDADAICAEQFGPGWTILRANGLGSRLVRASDLLFQREYWVHYAMSTFENCWRSSY